MYYLTVIKHFVSIVAMICDPVRTPFSLILDHFDPSFLQNVRSDWVQFLWNAEPSYQKYGEVPPPRG